MKRLAIGVGILLCAGLAVCGGAAPQGATPSVNDILNRYVNALGGRDAISKLTSRISKGTLEVSGMDGVGTALSYAKAPNKYCSIITFPGYGEAKQGFDGQTGWSKAPDTGIVEMTGQELGSEKRGSDFYLALRIPDLYPKLTMKGQEDVGGFPAYLIEADPGDGSLRRLYFDVSSGLMVRSDDEHDSTDARDVAQTFLSDYREVEGVKLPFTVRQIHGQTTFTVKLNDVRMNQPIDDAIFAKPTQ
jgi:hypothetical protein